MRLILVWLAARLRIYFLAMVVAAVLFFVWAGIYAAFAQHNHAQGHSEYIGWASKRTGNCCNNQDCGVLAKGEWRETAEGTEVRIGAEWCPVRPEHFIIKGKSPDFTAAHACINKNKLWVGPICARLLCFVAAGGM